MLSTLARSTTKVHPLISKTLLFSSPIKIALSNSSLSHYPTPHLRFQSTIYKPTKNFEITENAAKKIKELKQKDQNENLILRISVKPGGCHGFQYIIKLEDSSSIKNKDQIFTKDNSRVVIDNKSLMLLDNSKIDYTTDLIGSQFRVLSSEHASSCGCGSSFSREVK